MYTISWMMSNFPPWKQSTKDYLVEIQNHAFLLEHVIVSSSRGGSLVPWIWQLHPMCSQQQRLRRLKIWIPFLLLLSLGCAWKHGCFKLRSTGAHTLRGEPLKVYFSIQGEGFRRAFPKSDLKLLWKQREGMSAQSLPFDVLMIFILSVFVSSHYISLIPVGLITTLSK